MILDFKRLSGFLVVGERKIFGEMEEILKIANEANKIMVRMVEESNVETLSSENEEISQLERQSDEVEFRIGRNVVEGAVNPSALDNLLACIDLEDSIVDNYRYLARELNRVAHVEPEEVRKRIPSLDSALLNMFRLATESFVKVRQLLLENNPDEMRRVRREIEHIEQEGDEIKDNGFDELYRLSPKIHYLMFTHYTEIIHKADDILDACEDISDRVVTIVTSMSK